jgi:hypothetical protein
MQMERFFCERATLTAFLLPVAREQFAYPATPSLFKKLEQLSQRSGVRRSTTGSLPSAIDSWYSGSLEKRIKVSDSSSTLLFSAAPAVTHI